MDSAVIAVIERLQRNGDYGQHIARLEEIAGLTTGSFHGRRSALRVAEYAHDESAKLSRAYQTLRITANGSTG